MYIHGQLLYDINQVSEMLKMAKPTIYNYMKLFKGFLMPKRGRNNSLLFTQDDIRKIKAIKKDYFDGLSTEQIQRKYGLLDRISAILPGEPAGEGHAAGAPAQGMKPSGSMTPSNLNNSENGSLPVIARTNQPQIADEIQKLQRENATLRSMILSLVEKIDRCQKTHSEEIALLKDMLLYDNVSSNAKIEELNKQIESFKKQLDEVASELAKIEPVCSSSEKDKKGVFDRLISSISGAFQIKS